jgi:predicted nucleic acid-binding protein
MDQGNRRRPEALANLIMICLDTNYLIRALIPGTTEALAVEQWLEANESLCIPTVAWYEFLCGSTAEEEQLALALLDGGILPFGEIEAQSAAAGFRSLNKPRRLRVDAMIAATAIVAKASLATNNRKDFLPFVPHGLILH